MHGTIVVGIDGTDRGLDALALARGLADPGATTLHLVAVGTDRARAEHDLAAAHDAAGDDLPVETWAVARHSAAHGLHDACEDLRADLLTVGSTHRGALGRTLLGGVGEQALHASPCAVAVAPLGHRQGGGSPPATILAGYDETAEAQLALGRAAWLAGLAGARLTVMSVVDLPAGLVDPGLADERWVEGVRAGRRAELDALLAALGAEAAEIRLPGGLAWRELVVAAADHELVVLGSRAYGPVGRLLAGSTALHVLRESPAPVLLVPRGAEQPIRKRAVEPGRTLPKRA
ncbi:MAG TPA: universal stress protein [Solirubrobacteraceae bacterium]|nr:universal stress protein [Solirubrobacteraceae bacterium]